MPTEYFIQRNNKDRTWEEVDEFIFKNWKYALDENEQPRYNGNRIVKDGARITFTQETELFAREFVHVAKIGGASHNDLNSTVAGGFCRKPEFVMIVKGNSSLLRKVGLKTYRAKSVTPAPKPAPVAANPQEGQ